MGKLKEGIYFISAIIGIIMFVIWIRDAVEKEQKLERGPCQVTPNIIYGTVNINQVPLEGVAVILKNKRIDSIQTTETGQDGYYQLTIGNFPECWLEGDEVFILVQHGLTNYENSKILESSGTEINIIE